ncbi:hypothetical protein P175DRAFT_0557057, partial [Aspergillus ochraceoroseus IBT 24754]
PRNRARSRAHAHVARSRGHICYRHKASRKPRATTRDLDEIIFQELCFRWADEICACERRLANSQDDLAVFVASAISCLIFVDVCPSSQVPADFIARNGKI